MSSSEMDTWTLPLFFFLKTSATFSVGSRVYIGFGGVIVFALLLGR